MSSNESDQSPNGDLSGIGKLLHLDPVLVAAMVTVITTVAALFGVELSHGKAEVFAVVGLAIIVIGAQLWARRKTLARRKVLAFLPDPVDKPNRVAAGTAVTTASDSTVIRAVRMSPGK